MAPGASKWPMGQERGLTLYFLALTHQLSLNKFFDFSTPSMRKVDDGKKEEENNVVFSGH